jgi:site-specific recombinase XerD
VAGRCRHSDLRLIMGKKQRDCAGCGAPVGYIGREYCCRCIRRIREQQQRQPCRDCGQDRVVDVDRRCVLCARRCRQCGHLVRSAAVTLCRDCRRRAAAAAAKSPCPRCGKAGFIRPETGWCGSCSRPGPAKDPPRICQNCGELRRHAGLGLCSACWQRHPDRAFIRADNLAAGLADPPSWLRDFACYVAARHNPADAAAMISALGRLLIDQSSIHPQTLVARARLTGRSIGPLARALSGFFTQRGLALPTDHLEQRAGLRRQRRIDPVPADLRAAVHGFEAVMINNRERARRSGTRPRTDHTIETALATVRDFACFIAAAGKNDWALVDRRDVEAFIAALPRTRGRRLSVLRQFFRHVRRSRLILVDPTDGVSSGRTVRGFSGRTLSLDRQRALFRRWTTDESVHPQEATLGLLALLHGTSSQEVRLLKLADVDATTRSVRLGRRPHPVPLDPATWTQLERCIAHREEQRTANPHLFVTRVTKAGTEPASIAYFTHLLDAAGVPPRAVRCTRLATLVNTMDPKLVAAAFGMDAEGVLFYLADHVDQARLPATNP